MKNKINNFLLAFILTITTMFSSLAIPVLATTSNASNGVTPIEKTSTIKDVEGSAYVSDITVDEMSDKLETKGYEIVHILQIIAKPFFAIAFIVCSVIALFGAMSKAGVMKGLFGMLICGCMYTATLYAPEIVRFFSNWLAS